jgi:hypothetical protein
MLKKPFLNTFLFGILTGIVIQLIAFYIVLVLNKSLIGYTERSAFDFFSYLMDFEEGRSNVIPKLLSLSVIGDLLWFFVFIWTDKLKSARGVIGSAFLTGIVIVILKFV